MATARASDSLPAAAGDLLNRGRVAGILLHDLGSPLSTILLYADILLGSELEPYAMERVQRIRSAALGCQELAGHLKAILAPDPPRPENLSLPEMMEAALRLCETRLKSAGVEPALSFEPGLPLVRADRPALLALLLTLLAQEAAARIGEPARLIVAIQAAPGAEGEPAALVRLAPSAAARAWLNEPAAAGPAGLDWLGAQETARLAGARLSLEADQGQAALVVVLPAAGRP